MSDPYDDPNAPPIPDLQPWPNGRANPNVRVPYDRASANYGQFATLASMTMHSGAQGTPQPMAEPDFSNQESFAPQAQPEPISAEGPDLGSSDFRMRSSPPIVTPDALHNTLQKLTEQENDTMGFVKSQLAPLQDLQSKAVAATSAFTSSVGSLMDEQKGLNADLVKSLSMPAKIGRLFSLFGDNTYNPDYQRARVSASQSRIANEKFKYDATMDNIKIQSAAIQQNLTAREHVDDIMARNAQTLVSAMNADRENSKAEREQAVFDLSNSFKSEQLANYAKLAQKTGSIKIGGRDYTSAEVGEALDNRTKTNLTVDQLQTSITSGKLGNYEKQTQINENAIKNYVSGLPLGVIESKLADPNGLMITREDGQQIHVEHGQFVKATTSYLNDSKDARQFVSTMSDTHSELLGKLVGTTTKAETLLSLPDLDPTIAAKLKPQLDSLNEFKYSLAGAMNTAHSPTGVLSPEQMQLLTSPEIKDELQARHTDFEKKVAEASTQALASLPPIAKKVAEERLANNGNVVNVETAVPAVVSEIASPTAYGFSGHRAIMNAPFQDALTKIFPDKSQIFGKDGAAKSGIDLSALLNNATDQLAKDPNYQFLKVDQQFKGMGGFKGAIAATDVNEILRQGLVQYVEKYKPAGMSDIITADGNWAPQISGAMKQFGPIQAFNKYIAGMDAENIAKGTYRPEQNQLQQIYTFITKQYQSGAIKVDGNSNLDKASDLLAYGKDKPRALANILYSIQQSARQEIADQLQMNAPVSMVGAIRPEGGGLNIPRDASANDARISGGQQALTPPVSKITNPWLKRYLGQ